MTVSAAGRAGGRVRAAGADPAPSPVSELTGSVSGARPPPGARPACRMFVSASSLPWCLCLQKTKTRCDFFLKNEMTTTTTQKNRYRVKWEKKTKQRKKL